MPSQLSDHDLLIRMDERLEALVKTVEGFKSSLDKKVEKNKEYIDMECKVNSMWDSKNKVIGYIIGASVAGGTVSTLIGKLL